jgi:hypothetical protein
MDANEQLLAHKLLYAVEDVFPDKRTPIEAWTQAIDRVNWMRKTLDEQAARIKVLEANLAGAATSIKAGA